MAKKSTGVGGMAALGAIGLILITAIAPGALPIDAGMFTLLIGILGLLIGFFNVKGTEAIPYLIVTTAISVVSFTAVVGIPTIGTFLSTIIGNLGILAGSAALPVAGMKFWNFIKN